MILNELLSLLDETTEIHIDVDIKNPYDICNCTFLNVFHGTVGELKCEHSTPEALCRVVQSIKLYKPTKDRIALDINLKGVIL